MAPKSKRARLTQANAKKIDIIPEDYLSSLPNEILVSILSRLSIKGAGVTSLLSRQWQNLWTYVRRLNFASSETLGIIASDPRVKVVARSKYINWVNSVIGKHSLGVTLDVFRVSFDLDNSSKSEIDNWLRFAIGKRVQCLELNFFKKGEYFRQPESNYTIPSFMNVNSFDNPCISTGLKYLKALVLKSVNVSDEAVNYLLSVCPMLKYISIHGVGGLKKLKISGFAIRLMYLEIVLCLGIESIYVSNVNLVSFKYLGAGIDLTISNVPMLKEVTVSVGHFELEISVFSQLSCCLYQLKNLKLCILHPHEVTMVQNFPLLPNLKQLTLKIGAWNDDCLLPYVALIKRCPRLDRFVMQLIWMAPKRRRRKLREAAGSPHEFLKRVEIVGYYGRISDAEIAMYCIQNCVSMKNIVIDPHNQIVNRAPVKRDKIKKEEDARIAAKKQLEDKIPHGVKLIIL